MEMKDVHIRLPYPVERKLKEAAVSRGISLSEMIRLIALNWLGLGERDDKHGANDGS